MHTTRRPFTTLTLAALGLACVLAPPPARSGASAATATSASVTRTYTLTRQGQVVTLRDGEGKTLLQRRAATPILRMLVTGVGAHTEASAPSLSLTLEDANGLRLWSSLVRISPRMHSAHFSANWDAQTTGTRLGFAFSTEGGGDQDWSGTDGDAAPAPLVILFGAGGRLISAKAGEVSARRVGDGVVMTGPDGTRAAVQVAGGVVTGTSSDGTDLRMNMTEKGGTMRINGQTIPITRTTRDGKPYLSFSWNGHNVLVGDGCTFSVSTDGDLTVDAPKATGK